MMINEFVEVKLVAFFENGVGSPSQIHLLPKNRDQVATTINILQWQDCSFAFPVGLK
jgi:hypothetical protein